MHKRAAVEAFEKLKKKARDMGLTVDVVTKKTMDGLVSSMPVLACYSHEQGKIFVRDDLLKKKSKLVYIFAHELGHAIDHRKNKRHSSIYKKMMVLHRTLREHGMENRQIPEGIGETIVMMEENAFDEGDALMEELGIDFSKREAKKLRRASMEEYEKKLLR